MNLLCSLGWHRPGRLPRWHDGLYFSKCLRCGRDLVRTPKGAWRVLTDYRVDWREPEEEPAPLPALPRVHSPEPPPASDSGPFDAETAAESPVPPNDTGSAPDFMADEAEGISTRPEQSPAAGPPRGRPRFAVFSSVDTPALWTGAALAGAGAVVGVLLAVLILANPGARSQGAAILPPAVIAVPTPTPPPTAAPRRSDLMVAERTARCSRARRRRESRAGEQDVRLLTDGHWVTLTRAGTRCRTLRTGERPAP